jgi:hypothetical protein
VHLLGFSDLIGAMRLSGSAPGQIVVRGVQPERIEWGTQPTVTVDSAVGELVESAIRQVRQLSGEIEPAQTEMLHPSISAISA